MLGCAKDTRSGSTIQILLDELVGMFPRKRFTVGVHVSCACGCVKVKVLKCARDLHRQKGHFSASHSDKASKCEGIVSRKKHCARAISASVRRLCRTRILSPVGLRAKRPLLSRRRPPGRSSARVARSAAILPVAPSFIQGLVRQAGARSPGRAPLSRKGDR